MQLVQIVKTSFGQLLVQFFFKLTNDSRAWVDYNPREAEGKNELDTG